jgi:hypothetical protein
LEEKCGSILEEKFGSILMFFATRVTRFRDKTNAGTVLRLDMYMVSEEICRKLALMRRSHMPAPFGVSS